MICSPTSGTIYTFTKDPVSDSETDPTRVTEADLFGMIVGGDVVPGQGGRLIAGLLGGVGIALNNQRYRDSVQSFKSLLQSQFSDLDTVANDRSDDWQCSANAETTQPTSGSTVPRGQSDCFIL